MEFERRPVPPPVIISPTSAPFEVTVRLSPAKEPDKFVIKYGGDPPLIPETKY